MRVLLIEDDAMVGKAVHRGLVDAGFAVDWVTDGRAGELALSNRVYDAAILDLGLPKKDGMAVLHTLRNAHNSVPILIASARDTVRDRIDGLEAGADDYLPKPFDPRELILRITNILRRGGPQSVPKVEQIVFGPYTFQIARRELKKGGEPLKLTDREQEILAIFAERAGETIPRHELVGGASEVGERTIDVQINRLRRKIERDPSNPVWLQTVRGIGYRLSVE